MRLSTCVVFDIDDTLYLERDYAFSGFEAVGRWVAARLQIVDFALRCRHNFVAGRRRSIFDDVLRECGKEPSAALVGVLVEVYRMHTPSITLAADAAEAINTISRMSSIAVITDGPAISQSRKVEALGLREFAAPIVLTDVMGPEFSKPHPRAFKQVEKCRPARGYVYVADNPIKDFAAPKQLGWATVRVRRQGGLHCTVENTDVLPDREMKDCSGLVQFVSQL